MYTYTSVSGKLAKEAIQGHSGQMSSKTKLVGLGIFRCGNEKSVHGSSVCMTAHPKLLQILPQGTNLVQRNATSVSALESAEWFTFQRNYLFWTRLRP